MGLQLKRDGECECVCDEDLKEMIVNTRTDVHNYDGNYGRMYRQRWNKE